MQDQTSHGPLPALESGLHRNVQALYRNHRGWLFNWLRRRLGCPDNAADLLQDTYLRMMLSGRTPPPDQARPHLMQIAKGLVIDRYRRQQVEQAYLDALAAQPDSFAPSAEERAIVLDTLLRICAILDELAPRVRETFLLSRFEGLTYSEIAAREGISVATVRKHMFKATAACFSALSGRAGAGVAAPSKASGRGMA